MGIQNKDTVQTAQQIKFQQPRTDHKKKAQQNTKITPSLALLLIAVSEVPKLSKLFFFTLILSSLLAKNEASKYSLDNLEDAKTASLVFFDPFSPQINTPGDLTQTYANLTKTTSEIEQHKLGISIKEMGHPRTASDLSNPAYASGQEQIKKPLKINTDISKEENRIREDHLPDRVTFNRPYKDPVSINRKLTSLHYTFTKDISTTLVTLNSLSKTEQSKVTNELLTIKTQLQDFLEICKNINNFQGEKQCLEQDLSNKAKSLEQNLLSLLDATERVISSDTGKLKSAYSRYKFQTETLIKDISLSDQQSYLEKLLNNDYDPFITIDKNADDTNKKGSNTNTILAVLGSLLGLVCCCICLGPIAYIGRSFILSKIEKLTSTNENQEQDTNDSNDTNRSKELSVKIDPMGLDEQSNSSTHSDDSNILGNLFNQSDEDTSPENKTINQTTPIELKTIELENLTEKENNFSEDISTDSEKTDITEKIELKSNSFNGFQNTV